MESIKTISRIGSFGLATLLLSGCGRRPETHPAAQPGLAAAQVQVHTAESREQATTEEVAGTVRAKLRATLEAKLSGRIDKMPVLLGQGARRNSSEIEFWAFFCCLA